MLIRREEYLNKVRPFYDIDIVKRLIGKKNVLESLKRLN